MRIVLIAFTLLAACMGATHAQTRAPFSFEALVADAQSYVANRYAGEDLPTALIADLTAAEFQCQHSAAGSECSRIREATASCFDVASVRIAPEGVVAERDRRCMGAEE